MGADVNEVDTEGQTPLFYAASWGHAETCEELLGGGAEVDKKDECAWLFCSRGQENYKNCTTPLLFQTALSLRAAHK